MVLGLWGIPLFAGIRALVRHRQGREYAGMHGRA
jgi:hypothetical protein